MLRRVALNPHHWCTLRWVIDTDKPGDDGVRTDGCHGLATALAKACNIAIDDGGATRVVIFDGQQSDGAKVVAVVDLGGVNALAPFLADAVRVFEAPDARDALHAQGFDLGDWLQDCRAALADAAPDARK